MMDVKIDVSTLSPEYRSRAERDFANLGAAILGARFGVAVLEMRYEAVKFHIPGGTYTPDFLAVLKTGQILLIEIKGSRRQKNYRDARSKLRAAAECYPWWTWCECVAQDGYRVEVVK